MAGDDSQSEAFERDLTKLPSVMSAMVVNERGRVSEVHIVSDGSKDVRQLKRDVETLAKAQHRIPLDHRVISITRWREAAAVETAHPALERVSVTVTTHADGVTECAVVVRQSNERGEAQRTTLLTPSGLLRLVADVTLDACMTLGSFSAVVEHAARVTDSVVTVVVAFGDAKGATTIAAGSGVDRGDAGAAAADATIAAVNSHLSR